MGPPDTAEDTTTWRHLARPFQPPVLSYVASILVGLVALVGGYVVVTHLGLPMDLGFAVRAIGVGLAGGIAGGLVAGGIGLISVPLITLFLGFPIHLAVGTNLFQTLFTAAGGAWEHGRLGNVNGALAVPLLIGAAIGAPLGALASLAMPASALKGVFSIVLVGMALRMAWEALTPSGSEGTGFHLGDAMDLDIGQATHSLVSVVLPAKAADRVAGWMEAPIEGTFEGSDYRVDRLTPAVLGAGIAFVAGLLGVGGGFLVTPLVALLLDVSVHLALGTGLVVITGNALFGLVPHLVKANVAFVAGGLIAFGGVIGARLGSRISDKLSERTLYGLFTVLLVIVAWKMAPL